jgi:hypothetical protein
MTPLANIEPLGDFRAQLSYIRCHRNLVLQGIQQLRAKVYRTETVDSSVVGIRAYGWSSSNPALRMRIRVPLTANIPLSCPFQLT